MERVKLFKNHAITQSKGLRRLVRFTSHGLVHYTAYDKCGYNIL